jgi:transposase
MPGKHKNRGSNRDPDTRSGQHLTSVQRAEILVLFHRAKWSKRRISRELEIAESTVRKTISRGIVTPDRLIGRPAKLTTRKRRRLIARATQDAFHRRLSYLEIAKIEGLKACKRTLFKAFAKEGYFRRKSTRKPFLNEEHRRRRVEWAKLHKDWDFAQWRRVDWTDESMIRLGGFGDVWVTRTVEEKYDPACATPKFRHQPGLMLNGALSGVSKGPLVIFEKNEKVTAQVYSTKVLPGLQRHIKEMEREVGLMRAILMEDNASVHTASFTQAWHCYYGFIKMNWPANSPDLNPIENVWRLLKYRIGKRLPRTIDQLRQYI